MNKSWKLTISSIVIAVVMILLPSFGITNITEEQITSLVYLALGISTIGAGAKATKTWRDVKSYSPEGWYSVNFSKSLDGNYIKQGKSLIINSNKVRSYLTIKLSDMNDNILQINQTTAGIPIEIKLKESKLGKIKNYPLGKYKLHVSGDYGSSDSVQITDVFSIV